MLAAASLCTQHGLTTNTLICFPMEWSPRCPVCTEKSRKIALDKTGTPKQSQLHAVHSYRESIPLPDSKGIGNKHRKHFLLDQKDIYNVKNIAMYFTQATNTESCGDRPSFLLTLSVFLVTPC